MFGVVLSTPPRIRHHCRDTLLLVGGKLGNPEDERKSPEFQIEKHTHCIDACYVLQKSVTLLACVML